MEHYGSDRVPVYPLGADYWREHCPWDSRPCLKQQMGAPLCQSKAGGFIGQLLRIGALRSVLIGDLFLGRQ